MRHAQAEGVLAGDVCACNQVLDAVARQLLGAPFDADGRAASTGAPNAQATSRLRELLAGQATQRRSLGTGDEVGSWIGEFGRSVSPGAMAASACDAIASVVMTHLHGLTATAQTCDVLLAGGGVHNLALRHALATRHGGRVRTTDDVGVPAQYREAACFGVLGVLSADGVPITLPQVTGAVKPGRAGVWVFP